MANATGISQIDLDGDMSMIQAALCGLVVQMLQKVSF